MEKPVREYDCRILCCKICSQRLSVAKRCSRCKQSFYCSRNCQMKDWAQHRLECHPVDITSRVNDGKVLAKANDGQTNPNPLHCGTTQYTNVNDCQQQLTEVSKVVKEEILSENMSCEFVKITVMSNKTKHKLSVNVSTDAENLWKEIASKIRVPADELKLIHKGRKVSKDDILQVVKEKAVFQAIGVEALSEEGLNSESVSYIMRQMNVDRNSAITALRLKADVVDAILYLGNK